LLARAEALRQVLTDDPGSNPVDERARHANVDVSLEQSGADFSKSVVYIGVAKPAAASKTPENPLEPV